MDALDEERLMTVCDGDREGAYALLQLAVDSTRDLVERMRIALDQGDVAEMGVIVHEMRGSCSSVGAVELARLAHALEEELEIQNATTLAAARIEEFHDALDRLEAAKAGLRDSARTQPVR